MFFENVVPIFGWPMSIYCDNGMYFMGSEVQDTLRAFGVMQIGAPISYPSSVGLSERYVQMIVVTVRRHCIASKNTEEWGMQVGSAAISINIKRVQVHGYTPSEILLDYNARISWPPLRMREGRVQVVAEEIGEKVFDMHIVEKWNIEEILATRDYRGDDMIMKRIAEQDKAAAVHDSKLKWMTSKEGDLVMVRRHEVDKHKGLKLETRWDGPRLLVKLSKQENSAMVKELHGGKMDKRYHVDDLKIYVSRQGHTYLTEGSSRAAYEEGLREEGEKMGGGGGEERMGRRRKGCEVEERRGRRDVEGGEVVGGEEKMEKIWKGCEVRSGEDGEDIEGCEVRIRRREE
ncbi:hypothetical protein BGX38DRAFT_1272216 [Terfezia claveryi]|nr:hypothetical protein BGX38DRAFT_1272216 [Terfezia claveryi]